MTDLQTWLLAGLTVGQCMTAVGAVGLWWRLREARKLLAAESSRLDWLDTRVGPVVENQGWGNPYGEHVSNAWEVEWPASTVREAIDACRAQDKEQP